MATQNLTRELGRHKKRDVSVFTTFLDIVSAPGATAVSTSGDDYELFVMPPESLVTHASMVVVTANNAGTSAVADLGFGGDDTLIDGADLTSAAGTELDGGTNAEIPAIKATGGTVTFSPTYAGTAPTAGRVLVRVEYIEYEQCTGELTEFSTTGDTFA